MKILKVKKGNELSFPCKIIFVVKFDGKGVSRGRGESRCRDVGGGDNLLFGHCREEKVQYVAESRKKIILRAIALIPCKVFEGREFFYYHFQ